MAGTLHRLSLKCPRAQGAVFMGAGIVDRVPVTTIRAGEAEHLLRAFEPKESRLGEGGCGDPNGRHLSWRGHRDLPVATRR